MMAGKATLIKVSPRNPQNPNDVRNARILKELANHSIDRTDIPVVVATAEQFCIECLVKGVSCTHCMVHRFADKLIWWDKEIIMKGRVMDKGTSLGFTHLLKQRLCNQITNEVLNKYRLYPRERMIQCASISR